MYFMLKRLFQEKLYEKLGNKMYLKINLIWQPQIQIDVILSFVEQSNNISDNSLQIR